MLEDVIADADNIVLLHCDLTAGGAQFRRIVVNRSARLSIWHFIVVALIVCSLIGGVVWWDDFKDFLAPISSWLRFW
jgi:hypothetical protein